MDLNEWDLLGSPWKMNSIKATEAAPLVPRQAILNKGQR